jgi:hypothetical protein
MPASAALQFTQDTHGFGDGCGHQRRLEYKATQRSAR